jgi:hypothetical protein
MQTPGVRVLRCACDVNSGFTGAATLNFIAGSVIAQMKIPGLGQAGATRLSRSTRRFSRQNRRPMNLPPGPAVSLQLYSRYRT